MADWFNDPSIYGTTSQVAPQPTAPQSTPTSQSKSWFDDPSVYQARAQSQQDLGPTTYHDTWDALLSGVHSGLGATAASLMGRITTPEFSDYWMKQAARQREAASEDIQSMTPAAQQAISAPIISREFWQHPFRAIGLQTAQQIPTIGAMVGAGAMGGLPAAAGVFALQNAGNAISDFSATVDAMPHEDLMKNPDYAALAAYMSPDDAKRVFIQQRLDQSALASKAAAIGGLAGLVPELGGMIRGAASRGIVGRVLEGGLESGISLGTASGATEALTQQASGQSDTGRIMSSATTGAITGGVFGGLTGLKSRGIVPKANITLPEDVRPVNESKPLNVGSKTETPKPDDVTRGETIGGQNTQKGSASDYKTKTKYTAKPPEAGAGASIPSSNLDEASTDALKAALKVTPESKPKPPPPNLPTEKVQSKPVKPIEAPQPPSIQPTVMPPPAVEATPVPIQAPPSTPSAEPIPSVTEPQSTLELQKQAVINNIRELMVYPRGEGFTPLSKAELKTLGQAKDQKTGDIYVFNKNGDNELTHNKVVKAVASGNINDLMGYGPVTKQEAISRTTQQGETPVAVVERTPEGTEVKAVAGTNQTAPTQTQALEQAKSAPENVVQVEHPTQTIGERFKAKQRELAQARILPDISTEGKRAEAVAAQAQSNLEKRRKQEEKLNVQREKGPQAGHRTKAELSQRDAQNVAADGIMGRHVPRGGETLPQIYARAQEIVREADQQGIKVPTEINETHSPGMMLLAEAKQLVSVPYPKPPAYGRYLEREGLLHQNLKDEALESRRAEGAAGLGSPEGVEEPATEQTASETEDKILNQIDTERKEAGYTIGKQATGFKVERTRPTIGDRIKAERAKINTAPTEAQKEAGNYAKGHLFIGGHRMTLETPAGGERSGITPEGKEYRVEDYPTDYGYIRGTRGADGDHIDVHINPELDHPVGPGDRIFILNQRDPYSGQFDEHKVLIGYEDPVKAIEDYARGFDESDRVTAKRIGGIAEMSHEDFKDWLKPVDEGGGDKSQPIHDGPSGQQLNGMVITVTKDGQPVNIRPQSKSTIKEALGQSYIHTGFGTVDRLFAKLVTARLRSLVGDVPIYYVTKDQIGTLSYENTLGFYSAQFNHIFMNMDRSPEQQAQTLIHEAVHAATVHAIEANPFLERDIARIMNEVYSQDNSVASRYGFTDEKEFIAEAMSNPKFQRLLERFKISNSLAESLGMPSWQGKTLWGGFVNIVRRMIGLPAKTYSALEAAMKLSEEATWTHDPMEAARQILQTVDPNSEKGEGLLFKNHYAQQVLDDPDEFSKKYEKGVLGVTSKIADTLKSSGVNISAEFARKGRQLLSATQIFDADGHLFQKDNINFFRNLINAREKVGMKFQDIAGPGRDLVREGYLLQKQFDGPQWRAYGRLKELASTYQVDPTGSAPKYSISNMQAHVNYDKVKGVYDQLDPKLKKFFRDELEYYRGRRREIGEMQLRKALDQYEPPSGLTHDQAIEKILDSTQRLTPEEREHYKNLGVLDDISTARELNKDKVYFPAHREGDFVIEGKHEIPAGGNTKDLEGNDLPENVREFPDEQSAYDFVKSLELPATVRQLPGQNEVRVTVENRHLEMATTMSEARALAKAMMDAGIKNSKGGEEIGVQDLKNRDVQDSFTSVQARTLIDRIKANKNLTDGEKELYAETIRHASIANLTGNRIAKHWLRRQNIQGAEFETVNALEDYNNASSAYLARGEHQAEIDRALEGMDEIRKAGKDGPNSFRLGVTYNEMADRTQKFDNRSYSPRVSPLVQKMMTINFLRFLASPAHMVLHMMHPLLYSLPTLAGRHGYPIAYRAYARALNDIGGITPTLALGLKSAGKILGAAQQKDMAKAMELARGANFLETLTNGENIKPLEKSMFNALTETGHIHPNNGFAADTYRSVDLDRVNRATREITASAEAINRVATALSAYRLEYAKTLDHEGAINYARETLEKSQGLFSATNSAPFTRISWLRPFLQFRQFPMQIAWILGRNFHNMFKFSEPEIQKEALKTFGGIMGTAALLTGVNGMPTEVLKVPTALGNALGVTYSPEEYDDRFHRWVVDNMGKELGNVIMDGLPSLMGPLAPDIHHRAGLSSLFTFGQPSGSTPDDFTQWVTNAIFGTPGSLMTDTLRGINAMSSGNWNDAIRYLAPAKIIADAARAYKETEQGNVTKRGREVSPPLSAASGMLQVFGFTPQDWARASTGRSALYQATQRASQEKQNILNQMTKGDRSSALKILNAWNLKNPNDRITPSQLDSAIKTSRMPSAMGMKITPKNKELVDEYQRVYGH